MSRDLLILKGLASASMPGDPLRETSTRPPEGAGRSRSKTRSQARSKDREASSLLQWPGQVGCKRQPKTLSRSQPSRSKIMAVVASCLRSRTSRLEKVSINWVTASTRAAALACKTSSGALRSMSKAGMVQSMAVSGMYAELVVDESLKFHGLSHLFSSPNENRWPLYAGWRTGKFKQNPADPKISHAQLP